MTKPDESPELKDAINSITKWAALKGWKSDSGFIRSLTTALKKYCADPQAIRACIDHFFENSKFVPAPSEIKDIARSKAWGVQGQVRLRQLKIIARASCEKCMGDGQIVVTKVIPRPEWHEGYQPGQTVEASAVAWCSCDYGQARAKASAAQGRKAQAPPTESKPESLAEIAK